MTRKCHNHRPQSYQCYREEGTQNTLRTRKIEQNGIKNSTKQRIKCIAQGHNIVSPSSLEPATL